MSATRPAARQVTVLQALGLLVTFVLLAGVGGLLTAGLVLPAAAGASAMTNTATKLFDELPTELEPGEPSQASHIYAANGKLLATFYAENRTVVDLDEISMAMQNAVIAIEDKRFFAHGGVDVEGMARALVLNATTGSKQGASTLTQQYVKNVLIEEANRRGDKLGVAAAREGTNERKLREAKLAIAIEDRMSKLEILEAYLNIAQFGVSVYGVEAAASYYFGTSAAELTPVQAATIAGITKAPAKYDPERNPENAEARRNIVLREMYTQGYITKAEYDEARALKIADTLKITPTKRNCEAAGGAAYFCDYVTKVLLSNEAFGTTQSERDDLLYRGGLEIHTTIDLDLQKIANKELRNTIPTKDASGLGTAMSVVEPGTGKILAMAQNRTYVADPEAVGPGKTSVNYNTDQKHGGSRGFQAGSTFKAFTLTEWLREGKPLNASVSATKTMWPGSTWRASCIDNYRYVGEYGPGNSDGRASGQTSVLRATAFSVNTAFVAMESQLDLCGVAESAHLAGFRPSLALERDDPPSDDNGVEVTPSMTLGTQNTSPLAMANAYATFASGGTYCDPVAITQILTASGEELPVPQANCRTTLDAEVANGVTYALQKVLTEGGATRARLAGGRVAAGKTGTAQLNRHTWFIGYTPQLATAVWIGNPDRDTSMQYIRINGVPYSYVYGSTLAAPTWKRFMDRALEGKPNVAFPDPTTKTIYGERVPVPWVGGRSVADATRILNEAGFSVVVNPAQVPSSYPRGTVANTNPSGTTTAGSTITLNISSGEPVRTDVDDDGDDDGDDEKDKKKDKKKERPSRPGRGNTDTDD
ncbi:penicillin-binding protein [Flavimobilis sp. GY10621]|uniref:Penicillin-binding protein n=1 Tax=Flavimobilis rhizosphaerae TaxID=2775421 RepID=A0ABR9DN52_9MICO|nr:transglycosylase domain-containing protein [Flavimobilis rhizosphaerae]MBD9698554.1 penicillin-binding protein [Flavimobilis rhizosphaerae]